MNPVPYDFLEKILEVPALRLQAFAGILAKVELSDAAQLQSLIVYAHLLRYSPPEIATLLVTKVMEKHGEGLAAISVINKSGLVTNGEVLWDIATAKEADPAKLQGIYEQHGLDLEEYTRLILETFKDVEAKRAQRRTFGAPRAGTAPAPSDAPAAPPASPRDPGSA